MALTSDAILTQLLPAMTEEQREFWLELAGEQLSAETCPSKRNQLLAYLAAHLFTMNERGGASGNITSIKEGELAIGYGQSGMNQANLMNGTSYGVEYIRILNACLGPKIYVSTNNRCCSG